MLQEFTTGGVLKLPFSTYSPAPLNSQQAVRKNMSFLYIYIMYVMENTHRYICFDFYMSWWVYQAAGYSNSQICPDPFHHRLLSKVCDLVPLGIRSQKNHLLVYTSEKYYVVKLDHFPK